LRITRTVGASTITAAAASAIAAAAFPVAGGGFSGFELFGVAGFFKEISDVEEGVALQANVHKTGLHAGKDARDATVVNGAGERVLILALVIDFREFVFFDDSQTRLMRRAGYINFFRHTALLSAG
jgi:hypothetical protein